MAFEEISGTYPHVGLACLSFGLIIVGSVALAFKQRFDLSEVIIAVIYGLIVGPHCLDWLSPNKWGNTYYITLELSRIVMNIQIFGSSVELPPKYIMKNWLSLVMVLGPIMVIGYMLNSIFIWKLLPPLRWVEALVIAGCVTATDPVLASAVVANSDFAKSLPQRITSLLSAESASNDGMALPFMMLPVHILLHEHHANEVAKDFIVLTVLYEVLFGCILGAVIGFVFREIFKFSGRWYQIKGEHMLAFNIIMGLWCAGVGSVLGVDDFLVSFFAGAAFSWDKWAHNITADLDVTGFIDFVINTSYFIYFGAIIPWESFNDTALGMPVWRLIVISILILVGRRIPALLILKPVIPAVHSWKDALICGHFGPIGVAAIYMSLLASSRLEGNGNVPEDTIPTSGVKGMNALARIWPVTCFIVLSSVIVHGLSVRIVRILERVNNKSKAKS